MKSSYSNTQEKHHLMLGLIFLVGIFNVIDAGLTIFWINAGLATEANPIMEFVLRFGFDVFLIFKIMLVTSCLFVLWITKNNIWSKALIFPIYFLYCCIMGMHGSFAAIMIMTLKG